MMKNCPTFKELLQSANPVYRFKHVFKLATTIMFLCEKPLINLDPITKQLYQILIFLVTFEPLKIIVGDQFNVSLDQW